MSKTEVEVIKSAPSVGENAYRTLSCAIKATNELKTARLGLCDAIGFFIDLKKTEAYFLYRNYSNLEII